MNQKRKRCTLLWCWRELSYILCIFLLIIASVCAGVLLEKSREKQNDQLAFEKIAETLQAGESIEPDQDMSYSSNDVDTDLEILAAYHKLADENPDFIGWVRIEDTTVNYPVMYTPDNPSYYLKRNFQRDYSELGTPFMQETCDPYDSENMILYGHHMIAGGMFSDLELYKNEEFWEKHKVVRFDTLQECGEYEVFAVAVINLTDSDWFRFHEYTEMDENRYQEYVDLCMENSLYDTGIVPALGDRLITLATCEYSSNNGRLIVVGREISKEETK